MVLVVLVVLDTQPRRDSGALLRADKVFTPSEEVQLLKARVEYILGQLYPEELDNVVQIQIKAVAKLHMTLYV